MMNRDAMAEGLMALAMVEAATPEGRRRLALALRATLRAVDAPTQRGVDVATEALAEHLTCAAEHVEFLRESVTTPPPA